MATQHFRRLDAYLAYFQFKYFAGSWSNPLIAHSERKFLEYIIQNVYLFNFNSSNDDRIRIFVFRLLDIRLA